MSSDNDSEHNQDESDSAKGPAKNEIVQPLASESQPPKQQQQAASQATRTPEERSHFWNVLTTVGVWTYTLLTLVILVINVFQWQTTKDAVKVSRDTFEAIDRPYIGVNNIGLDLGKGEITDASIIGVEVEIKNFGAVPATKFNSEWSMFIDGIQVPWSKTAPDAGRTIFPNGVTYLWGKLNGATFLALKQGRKRLKIEIPLDYYGPGEQHYKDCEVDQYRPPNLDFLNLGPMCSSQSTNNK